MEWQPIETAPKDGTEVLVYEGKAQWVCYWGTTEQNWMVTGDIPVHGVTHWLPLPEAPAITEK